MRRITKAVLASAALAGIITGAAARVQAATASTSQSRDGKALSSYGKMDDTDKDKGKHECKGKNTCKGQGGCQGGDNGCKGKNSCKGKGGCNTATPHE